MLQIQNIPEKLVENQRQHIALLPATLEARNYPEELCVHQLFADQVKQTPDACAVVDEQQQLTYSELNQRANQLAHYLRACGVRPETCVGIALERSIEMVVAVLAIFKAGGAYLPLDPKYPQERLAFMLEDAHVPIILTQAYLAENLPSHRALVIQLDQAWEVLAQQRQDNVVSEVTPQNLAYVIYTSGSTGKPKGVLVPHQGLCSLAVTQLQIFGASPQSRVLQFASLNFDVSISEIVMALLTGATLYLGSQEALLPGPALLGFLERHAITLATFSPSVLANLPDATLPSLQTMISAGEACSAEIITRWGRKRQFFNAYGPTETTVYATVAAYSGICTKVSIGHPITNLHAYILDQAMQIVPAGSAGELYLGGVGIARGYLNRPEITSTRFVPDPFSAIPGARLYKTGDLARSLPDGRIEFIGRIDRQVKWRGFRIELGEIEAVLHQHAAIQQAIVMLREDRSADKRLVAYILLRKAQRTTNLELRTHLQKHLPHYMLPSAFVFLEAFPLTPNNKLDLQALPLPTFDQFEREQPFLAPRNDVEEKLVAIWQQVLGVAAMSIRDNFFVLGGHSLLATQVLARIRDAFQVDLPFQDFFDDPTIEQIATYIQEAQQIEENYQLSCFSADRTEDLSLSYAQQRLWFLDQWETSNTAYNLPVALRLLGPIDVAALQQSLREIVRRHEILRTTFKAVGGQPIQVIATEASGLTLQLPVIDLTAPSLQRERERLAQQLATQEAQTPFDLSEGPLMRIALLSLAKEDHIFLLTMHHIISDGWSMSLFFDELNALYDAYLHGKPSPLPDLPMQYADFASWQREWLEGEVTDTQVSYWKRQLHNVPEMLQLATDKPRPAVQSFHGSTYAFSLSAELTNALKGLSLQEECTLFMTLFAAFTVLLYRYTRQEDLCVGTPIANRTHTEIERLIGFFVNMLVLRTRPAGTATFLELLRHVRRVTLEAYSHQDIPFERLVEEIRPERDSSYHPLAQVMFVLQNTSETAFDLPGVSIEPFEIDSVTSLFDLTLELRESAQGLKGRLEYNTDLFEPSTIQRMAGHFQTLLEAIVAHAERPISDLPLLTAAELQQFREWNRTDMAYPATYCTHQLFEQQVQRTPDAIAIIAEDRQLTYQELNTQANQLAHHLQKLGVKPGIAVGVCAERSIEMIIGLIAIFKAGGVYVPLDPAYPQDRLAFMLEDADVAVLLTQQQYRARLSFYQQQILCLDGESEIFAHCQSENPANSVTYKDLAYIIYTSGSTGQPKGVMIEHKGLLNLIYWHQQTFAVTNSDKATQIAGPAFDASIWELLPYLTIGASIAIPSEQTRKDVLRLRDWLIAQSITISFLPTPLAERIIEVAWPHQVALRLLLTGGDKLRRYPPEGLPFTVVNNYGPTENTVVATSCAVPPQYTDIAPSIGRPIANTRIYLLDQLLQPVPVGVTGEVFIGGDGLARGYLNQPLLTREKFIRDPFSADPEARLYRTGDIARFCHDGSIEFIGRIDDQVKIRGFRIELGEIEAVLRQHPDVRAAVVTACENVMHENSLVAYAVLEQESSSSASELRSDLKAQLPDYMLPTAVLVLSDFPLTPNGKIDYKNLPLPDPIRQSAEREISLPRSATEEILASIYAKVLDIERVGIHDNFFEMGGHSLLTTQLVSLIYDTFQVDLPLTQIFDTPTVSEIAQCIEQAMKNS